MGSSPIAVTYVTTTTKHIQEFHNLDNDDKFPSTDCSKISLTEILYHIETSHPICTAMHCKYIDDFYITQGTIRKNEKLSTIYVKKTAKKLK